MLMLAALTGWALGSLGQAQMTKDVSHCHALTPAGDLLRVDLISLRRNESDEPVVLVAPVSGTPWPEGDDAYVAIRTRQVGNETEFRVGPQFMRLGTNQGAKNLTFLSDRDGKAAQAVAFGFCDKSKAELGAEAASWKSTGDVFDPRRWKNDCFLIEAGALISRRRFAMKHQVTADGQFAAVFDPKDSGIWPGIIHVKRDLLKPNPKSEAKRISLGVGRFKPDEGAMGPVGMDMIFIDEAARRASILVRFDKFNESERVGYAICGITDFKDKVQ